MHYYNLLNKRASLKKLASSLSFCMNENINLKYNLFFNLINWLKNWPTNKWLSLQFIKQLTESTFSIYDLEVQDWFYLAAD